jgi:hypothetical protein
LTCTSAAGLGTSNSGYVQQVEDSRKQRDLRFADPLTSPLSQVGGILLEGTELFFGSSPGADLIWKGGGIASRHLKIIQSGEQILLEPEEGSVVHIETGQSVTKEVWKADQMYQAGSVVLVLREHPVGPIVRILDPESEKVKDFNGHHYFPIDEEYRVQATIHAQTPKEITISDTQGWERPAWLFGQLEFTIHEKLQHLDLVLFDKNPTEDSVFLLMFRDQTSGRETYGACRYLSLPFQTEGKVWLDFNKASNPYCAYASSFACPLPPPGNRLSVPILAGEKIYSKSPH